MPPTPNDKNTELDDLAFEIYAKRTGQHSAQQSEAVVVDSYRKAAAFIEVKRKIAADGMKAAIPQEAPGADCRCPNLRKTHPYNLVAQNGGDLVKANRIKQYLDAHPTPAGENGAEELVGNINRHFNDLEWDIATVTVARQILPAYCKN